MAIEHSNRSLEIGDFDKMKEKFFQGVELGLPYRAFHVGTLLELKERAKEKTVEQRLGALEEKVEENETVKSDLLHLPTREDIDRFA